MTVQTENNITMHVPLVHTESHQVKLEKTGSVNSFQKAMMPVVLIAQYFAMLPVQGITDPDPLNLRFRWKSLRVLYSLFTLCGLLIMTVLCAYYFLSKGQDLQHIQPVVFFGLSLTMSEQCLQLARKWPSLVKMWHTMETEQWDYGYPPYLRIKVTCFTTVILAGALAEHTLSKYSTVMKILQCGAEDEDIFKQYLLQSYPQFFNYVPYSGYWGILLTYYGLVSAFSWTFIDIFVSVVSIAVVERFRLLNRHLQQVRGKVLPEVFWRRAREHFTALTYITEVFNSSLSLMVFLAFGSDLFFVCLQLFYSLKEPTEYYDRLYFYWSFSFLILRMMAMSLCVARINDESQIPKSILFAVPSQSYSTEVSRFLYQVGNSDVAFTGLNFFSVTRTFLLTLAGTIVTYEIVLVQFSTLNP